MGLTASGTSRRTKRHEVRLSFRGVSATGATITCKLTRYEGAKRTDGLLGRMSDWILPPAPGLKAKQRRARRIGHELRYWLKVARTVRVGG
jgi:hypothetical protein